MWQSKLPSFQSMLNPPQNSPVLFLIASLHTCCVLPNQFYNWPLGTLFSLVHVGDQNIPLQNMLLWHKDYFELEAMRIDRCRKMSSWNFLFLNKSRNFWKKRTAINPPSWGSFMATKTESQDAPAQRNLILLVSSIYLHSQGLQLLFLCQIPTHHCLLKCYICPNSNHPFELLFI